MPERRHRAALLLALGLALGATLGAGALTDAPAGAVVGDAPGQQTEEDLQLPVDPSRDPDQTRRRAEDILRGDEYQAPGPEERSVLDRIRDWIGDRLPDVEGPGLGGGSRVLSYVVFGVVVAGGLGALAYVLVRTQGTRRLAEGAGDTDAEIDVTPLRSPDEWDAEADRCERAGDHKSAVRARFRALTTALARRGLVADTPGRTAGELRGDVAERAPALGPAFGAVADLFERVWFGGGAADAEQSAAARDLVRTALAAAPRRASTASAEEDDR